MEGAAGFDYVLEKVNTIAEIDGKRIRTCYRCGIKNYVSAMIRVGSRYFCHPKPSCYDKPDDIRGDR